MTPVINYMKYSEIHVIGSSENLKPCKKETEWMDIVFLGPMNERQRAVKSFTLCLGKCVTVKAGFKKIPWYIFWLISDYTQNQANIRNSLMIWDSTWFGLYTLSLLIMWLAVWILHLQVLHTHPSPNSAMASDPYRLWTTCLSEQWVSFSSPNNYTQTVSIQIYCHYIR